MEPSPEDVDHYPPVKQVYIVKRAIRYSSPVRLLDIGISNYQFGKRLEEKEFASILKLAGWDSFRLFRAHFC